MRMRRKKNLEARLEKVSNLILVADKELQNELEAIKNKCYFNFNSIFNNDNAIELEIGCGKGQFISQIALNNPNTNYIAVELLNNVILLASEKVKEQNIKNVRFINSGAAYLPRYIPPKSVQNIYLNFSPPFPENSHENRRLTNSRYIEIYKEFLVDGGAVYQKTDNLDFFNYSKRKFIEGGFSVIDTTLSGISENAKFLTEYEEKFRKLGMPIYSLKAYIEK